MVVPGAPSGYAVAVSRWGSAVEAALGRLSPELGVSVYDLRLRVAGALPTVVERTTELERARRLLGWLRGEGHGAVACDIGAAADSEALPRWRGFELEAEALTLLDPQAGRQRVPYSAFLAVVRAVHVTEEESHAQTTKRQLSVGRAVMTGGLALTKRVTTESHEQREGREEVAYVYAAGAPLPWLLREHDLRYEGLGDRRGRTTAECFRVLVSTLAERAPRALHDDRFVRQRRRDPDVRVSGNALGGVARRSNAGATDLAVHLLVLAHTQRML